MRKSNCGSQGIKDATELEKRELEKKELAKKRRKERQAEVAEKHRVKVIREFIMKVPTIDMMAIKAIIPFMKSCDSGDSGKASIAGKDRVAINDYLNMGYKYYASYASASNVREHRREQAKKLMALLKRFYSPEQLCLLYPELYDIVCSEADVNEFVVKRKAMTSYYSKDDETDVHLKENVRDFNEQNGEDSDESQQPDAQNAREPVRTSPESHENVPDVEIPASDEKDAQKSEQATLQSILSECGMEDSSKTIVIEQTSMTPDGDGEETQTECGFFHRLKGKIGSSFLKVRKWFGEGENEEVSDGENHVENDTIQNDENASEEEE